MKPMFSIIHPTARPEQWETIWNAWIDLASSPQDVEYILVCDKRWGFAELPKFPEMPTVFRAVWNTGRRCYVDAVNIGAQYATGDVLLVIADDQFPCPEWDIKLAEVLADSGKEVIEVSTGTPQEHERSILVLPILTQERYERLGYLLFPGYESMYSDNDFCEMAQRDGQIADARHLLFPHKHPLFDPSVTMDEQYKAQNRPEAYGTGAQVLAERRKANFRDPKRKRIIVCLPGEKFSMRWVSSTMRTIQWMNTVYEINVVMGYTSNVYMARTALAEQCLEPEADYVLWIDDDNPVEPADVATLIQDLESIKEIDVVAGWCVCTSDSYESPLSNVSVGLFGEEFHQCAFHPQTMYEAKALMKVDWTGFPIVLMRQSVLKAIKQPFRPMPNERSAYGFDSEDLSFSRRLKEAGFNLAVDPRVKVPHLKLRDSNRDELTPAPAGLKEGDK